MNRKINTLLEFQKLEILWKIYYEDYNVNKEFHKFKYLLKINEDKLKVMEWQSTEL